MRDTNPANQTIKDDFGITNVINDIAYTETFGNPPPSSVPGARLDLILHNTQIQTSKICNRHESIGFNLFSDAPTTKNLSAMSRGGRGNLADGSPEWAPRRRSRATTMRFRSTTMLWHRVAPCFGRTPVPQRRYMEPALSAHATSTHGR